MKKNTIDGCIKIFNYLSIGYIHRYCTGPPRIASKKSKVNLCSSPCSSQFLQPPKRKRVGDKGKITFSEPNFNINIKISIF